jgi:hypothetical protein
MTDADEPEPESDFEAGVARLVANERVMLASLDALPATLIHAVTGSLGGGALGSPKAGAWALRLSVNCWREPGGPRREEALFVRRVVSSEAEIDRLIDVLQPHTLVRMRVRLKEIAPGVRFALLVDLLEPPDDAELAAIAAARAEQERVREAAEAETESEPSDLDHSRFGTLRWDPARSEWTAEVTWARRRAKLVIGRVALSDAQAALGVAEKLFVEQKSWGRLLGELLDGGMLELKNGTWLDEEERPLTTRRFRSLVRLHTIETFADGRFDLWFSDGDLFGGHDVKVSGRLTESKLVFSLVG